MLLRVKKKSIPTTMIYIMIFMPFFIPFLTQVLHIPGFIKYIMDFAALILFFLVLHDFPQLTNNRSKKIFFYWILFFFSVELFNYFLNYQSLFYFLWGIRNNFRGYILFFAIILYCKQMDIQDVFYLMNKLFYLNAVVMLLQYWGLGYKQDNLGGLFGVESGCNAYVNIFFCIYVVISSIRFFNKKISARKFIIEIFLTLVLAAMAELKFFYVEIFILLFLAYVITDFSWKKIGLLIPLCIVIFIGYRVFFSVFPDIDLSVAGMIEYATSDKGYTASGDFNRLNFINTVNTNYLKTPWKQLTGLGLGNCDYATGISMLTSPFSVKYGWTHYTWVSTIFMYLECGYFGLFLFFGFFVLVILKSIKKLKFSRKDIELKQITILCGIIAILNGFYNISMRLDASFMLYFMLAVPWINQYEVQKDELE